MRNVWKVWSATLALGVVAVGPASGCAQRPAVHPAPVPSATVADTARLSLPQLAAMPVANADALLTKSGLVPILRYEPGIVTAAGTVVNTDPPAGSLLAAGDTVTVIVAGTPAETLHDYVDAHRELFIGLGVDANGVLVVGVHESADFTKEMAHLSKVADGKPFRLQSCSRSWMDLMRLQHELARREFLPGADKLQFATAIDPLACAVRLTIDLPDAQIADLSARYKGALVIQRGTASRLG